MTKSVGTVILVCLCVLLIPAIIGIIGGAFGIVAGVFGAIIGLIGGLFGAIFGFIGWLFDGIFGWGWGTPFHFEFNPGTWLLIFIIIALLVRGKK